MKHFGTVLVEGRWLNMKWHIISLRKVKPEDKKDLPLFYKHCHIFYLRLWLLELSVA